MPRSQRREPVSSQRQGLATGCGRDRMDIEVLASITFAVGRTTERFYDTAVAMPFKFELRMILATERGTIKQGRCARRAFA